MKAAVTILLSSVSWSIKYSLSTHRSCVVPQTIQHYTLYVLVITSSKKHITCLDFSINTAGNNSRFYLIHSKTVGNRIHQSRAQSFLIIRSINVSVRIACPNRCCSQGIYPTHQSKCAPSTALASHKYTQTIIIPLSQQWS